MIQVILKDSTDMKGYTREEFSSLFDMRLIESLEFQKDVICMRVIRRSKIALRRREMSVKENWLGVRFKKEVVGGFFPSVSIQWVDPVLGYGVFAERSIPVGAYIGEYVGQVRRRTPRRDKKNDYLFEYTIGDWPRNPYIIDAREQGNLTRFINHSEDPNLDSLSVYANRVMHIIFTAKKRIKKGDQLCYHYGDYFWKKRKGAKILAPEALTN
ncbi:MAG: hypothetical protein KR126chlam1_01430 [Chlamydiae bacterium]|nr:hypothetical protein [Chlamydiota bacterium]